MAGRWSLDPITQSAAMRPSGPTRVTVGPFGIVTVCGENPSRIALAVQSEVGGQVQLSLAPSAALGVPADTPYSVVPVTVTVATHPYWVGLSWYALGTVGDTLLVWEILSEV